MSDDAWVDLPRAIEILSKHRTRSFPFHCERDELFVMSDPDKYSFEELTELDELGFFENDAGGFSSFRFGSARASMFDEDLIRAGAEGVLKNPHHSNS